MQEKEMLPVDKVQNHQSLKMNLVKSAGTCPESKEFWYMTTNASTITSAISFRTLGCISSGPELENMDCLDDVILDTTADAHQWPSNRELWSFTDTKHSSHITGTNTSDWSPKDEDDTSHSDEEATDSDVDLKAGGDSPIFSRTRSRISSDQLFTPQLRSRRSLLSTQGQRNDGIRASKPSVQFVHPGSAGTSIKYVASIAIIIVVSCSVLFLFWVNKPQALTLVERTALTMFLDKFDQVENLFYGQQSALWKRSKIILRNHINLTQHAKPAILMFAAAWDGQQTMRCLARRIADAYSTALNVTAVVEINATVDRGRDSDIVKLQVDTQLSYGFDKGSKVAVVHHFQDLPPLSSLIFYKYCDHENAAYKAVTLLITVLLDEEKLAPDISLKALEVKVHAYLKRRFSASEGGQGMDTDKLSGLWSRIAHVVLPVAPVREIEEGGCDSKEDGK
ncbi:torsin-1A-interacting protein 2-like isoform X4 [Narcine bancroftii]|uniref:torsin-1A-interacting protein 2-like isoform X4 n=1 Tax=Narcine bancroftii TaxID=1343680 RepID=UPI00383211AD